MMIRVVDTEEEIVRYFYLPFRKADCRSGCLSFACNSDC